MPCAGDGPRMSRGRHRHGVDTALGASENAPAIPLVAPETPSRARSTLADEGRLAPLASASGTHGAGSSIRRARTLLPAVSFFRLLRDAYPLKPRPMPPFIAAPMPPPANPRPPNPPPIIVFSMVVTCSPFT